MQIRLFDAVTVYEQVSDLVSTITSINKDTQIIITGLVPRPMDYPGLHKMCKNYNAAYRNIVQELKRKQRLNVDFVDVFYEFLELNGTLKQLKRNFVEEIFLSAQGCRMLRAIWLRHLGFFPKKAVEVASTSSSEFS